MKLIVYLFCLLFSIYVKDSRVSGAYCLGIFQNGKDPTTLLGGLDCVTFFYFVLFKVYVYVVNCSNILIYIHYRHHRAQYVCYV